jgi:hypothetical protein
VKKDVMAKKKKTKGRSRSIVIQHLEQIDREIFKNYQKEIADMIKGHHGVYALYHRKKLYYIGLASNLRNRIKSHIKDKHADSWTKFSLYIFKTQKSIRELEALLLRIADPKGNIQKGRLRGSLNLKPELDKQIDKRQREERFKLLGRKSSGKQKVRPKRKSKTTKAERPLKGLLRGRQRIYATYKGKDYKAKVRPNGEIEMIPGGQLYDTPSAAAKAIVDRRTVNGWKFWKYKDKNGELVYIDQLRK